MSRTKGKRRNHFVEGDIVHSPHVHPRIGFGIVVYADNSWGCIVRPQVEGAADVYLKNRELSRGEFVLYNPPRRMTNMREGYVPITPAA